VAKNETNAAQRDEWNVLLPFALFPAAAADGCARHPRKKCTRADLIIIIIVVVIAASLCHRPLIDDRRSHSVMYLEGINSLQQPPPEESDPLNSAQKVTGCDTATRNQEKWTLCGHLSE
jgi:hypothetical protein